MHDVHMCIIWGEILPDSVRRHTKNFFSTPHLRIHMPSKKTQRAATSCALHGEENLRIPPKLISDQQSAGKAHCYLQLRFNISNFHTILKNFSTVPLAYHVDEWVNEINKSTMRNLCWTEFYINQFLLM